MCETKEETRICYQCKRELPKTSVYFHRDNSPFHGGFRYNCKECRGYKFILPCHDLIPSKEDYKICTKCRKELPFNDFWEGPGAFGLYSHCKQCCKGYMEQAKQKNPNIYKERYQQNKDALKGSRRKYYKENAELERQRRRNYYYNNREKEQEYNKYWYKVNAEYAKQYSKNRYHNNKEYYLSKHYEWAQNNKDFLKKYNQLYRENNREKFKIWAHKRRALHNKLLITLTPEQWEKIKSHFDNKCAYCGKEKQLTMDHFIPLTKLGEFTHNNIIPACKSCNSSKYNKDFSEWYPTYRYYSKKREKKILDYLGYKGEVQQLRLMG